MAVGIVLVSHSAAVARGAAELAREMAGDVVLEPAGGLDEPGEPLGTDAVRVAEAIGRADSGDGVLVLMDLGSAVLSAETALDLVDGIDVALCDAPFVEGAVAGAVAAQAGEPLAAVAAEARRGLAAKTAHLGGDEPADEATPDDDDRRSWRRVELDVTNRLGLHGRPAARIVRTAARFDAEVRVADLDNGNGPVSARSLASVMALGVVRGHRIEVSAAGPGAAEVLEALGALAATGFGDEAEPEPAPPPVRTPAAVPDGVTFRGLAAAPGSALGPVRHLRLTDVPDPDGSPGTRDEEAQRLRTAVGDVGRELAAARDDAAATLGAEAADILEMQALLLDDAALLDAAVARVGEGEPAGRAWRGAVAGVVTAYAGVDDDYQRARVDDIEDVGRRVVAALAGVPVRRTVSGPGVVVAEVLGPADTAALDRSLVRGILTASGAPTGHAAILARALGVPAVVGAGEAVLRLDEAQPVLLDGDTGAVYVQPDRTVRREYERRQAAAGAAHDAALLTATEPAVTSDGVRITVEANVGSLADASDAARQGADGVGLLRTEFLFLGRDEPPTEDEQVEAYTAVAVRLGGGVVTVRTLDVGADKPAPYLRQAREDNPFLGVRGLRLGLARPDVLSTQLRAVLRVAADHPVRVMFPMVSSLDELDEASALLDRARAEVGTGVHLPVGVMVEVPAVGLLAEAFAERVDFLSVGTNDLTQYVLAADRGNAGVAALGDACHPAVLALVRRTALAARDRDRPVAVCGELAGDPTVTSLLVGLGVTELSVVPTAVPLVKQAVRATSYADATRLAEQALRRRTAAEVRRDVSEPQRAMTR
ncbi:MAG: phosphoenolpyruvate--protein phosphotransferase [Streptosporangiales bacterium]|nr:phosphoenolpyruvate--protein phosphotransferase [Streptosporangiales bacterium]